MCGSTSHHIFGLLPEIWSFLKFRKIGAHDSGFRNNHSGNKRTVGTVNTVCFTTERESTPDANEEVFSIVGGNQQFCSCIDFSGAAQPEKLFSEF